MDGFHPTKIESKPSKKLHRAPFSYAVIAIKQAILQGQYEAAKGVMEPAWEKVQGLKFELSSVKIRQPFFYSPTPKGYLVIWLFGYFLDLQSWDLISQ